MRATLSLTATAVISLTSSLAAQRPLTGRLEGTLTEKLATRSASAAWISLVQLEPTSGATINARPDARGHFHVDSLLPGRYLVQVGVPTLDSLELALPPTEVRIAGGETARADIALPSGARLRDVVCTGLKLSQGKGVVAGRVVDADSDAPLAGADIVASWPEITFDSATLKTTTQRQVAVARSGAQGEYRMCGVPTGRLLSVQLQHGGRAGAVLHVTVTDDEGVAVRDLSLSESAAPTIATLDSAARLAISSRDTTLADLQLTGTARLTGTVRGAGGQPLANAEVRVRDAREGAVTDSAGRFAIDRLPGGTQVMVVRQLGYALAELPVELRPGRAATHDVQLTRIVRLDSVKVLAAKPKYAEFERNMRMNPMGKFMTMGEIQRRGAATTADLIRVFGWTVGRKGYRSVARPREGALNRKCMNADVVIDGMQGMSLDDVDPKAIAGIEVYDNPSVAPARFSGNAECGVVVIWLRTGDEKRPQTKNGLLYNGYP